MADTAVQTHDAYIAALTDPDQRSLLADLRARLVRLLPDAEAVISYAMPAFRVTGGIVAGYAAHRRHCSFYPFSGVTLATLAPRTAGFSQTKSALHFTAARPIPDDLLALLLQARRAELPAR